MAFTLSLSGSELFHVKRSLKVSLQAFKESISDLEKCSDDSDFGKSLLSEALSYDRASVEEISGLLDRIQALIIENGGEADEK